MSVLDTFFYTFKPKDEGVVQKLDEIQKKSDGVKAGNEKVTESFRQFGSEAKAAIDKVLPGAGKLGDALGKIGKSLADARKAAQTRTAAAPPGAAGGGAGGVRPPTPPAAGAGAAGGGAEGLAVAAGAAAVGLAVATLAVAVFAKAVADGTAELKESRKAAQEAGINATQQAAGEQFAKSLRLNKDEFNRVTKEIADKTREGWVKSREFGNIFGIGNEQTQLLKRHGIRTSTRGGELRNSAAIFDDITEKMKKMSSESAIAFGQFFGMSKDMATAIKESGLTFSEYAKQHQSEIETQAKAIMQARAYEKAQQGLSNAWDTFAVKIGGKVIPVITAILEGINNAFDAMDDFGTAIKGFWKGLKDIANEIVSWVDEHTPDWLKRGGAKAADAGRAVLAGGQYVGKAIGGTVSESYQYWKDKGEEVTRKEEQKTQEEFNKKMSQQTSDNAQAAKTQLEAANLMKVATAKFGLSLDQYMAIWAGTVGKEGGLKSSGGIDAKGFVEGYKSVVNKYDTAEAAEARYFRGAPMMKQVPQQFAMGLGVTPLGLAKNPIGLAKSAVNDTNFTVGNGTSRGVEDKRDASKVIPVNVNTGPITIHTTSSDPEAINKSVSEGLTDHIKYAVNRLNDGQIA